MILNTPNNVVLNLTVSETDYGSVKAGQFGVATFDAITGQTFPIVIDAIGANPTTTQGVVTYSARAHFVDRGAAFAGNPAASGAARGGGQGFAASGTPFAGGQGGGRRAAPTQTAAAGAATPQAGATRQSAAPAPNVAPAASATPAAKPVPGMNARITIITEQRQDVLRVPNNAVQRDGQNRVIEVKQSDGTTQKVTVQVGLSDSTNIEITSGAEEGATVVIPGTTATAAAVVTQSTGGFPGGGFRGDNFVPGGGGRGGD